MKEENVMARGENEIKNLWYKKGKKMRKFVLMWTREEIQLLQNIKFVSGWINLMHSRIVAHWGITIALHNPTTNELIIGHQIGEKFIIE